MTARTRDPWCPPWRWLFLALLLEVTVTVAVVAVYKAACGPRTTIEARGR